MGDLGVFEADANAGKISAEAAANQGHELEKAVDRAIFRAKERFGAYLANSQSKEDFDERWAEVKPQAIRVIAEVTTPTPGVIRRVGAALRPSSAPTKRNRPSSAKTANEKKRREVADAHRDEVVPGSGSAVEPKDLTHTASTTKLAWDYDQAAHLYTSNNPMQKFACPGCGTEHDLGFAHCAGCNRTWNSWPVRQASSAKTGASTYILMAREIKMRGDQFKLAATGEVTISQPEEKIVAESSVKVADAPMPQEPPPGMSQPNFGTMPGDNSGAMGAPMPPEQPPVPGGDPDQDGDLAGGVTENSPIDQIQDALNGAVVALKDVQMLSLNPQLTAMGGLKLSVQAAERRKSEKVANLRLAMDRFWGLHKQLNYVAGMLAKEANEAIRTADPRITSEAEFVRGYEAAAKNEPLPAKTGKAYLEGFVAFHKQADSYDTGADIGRITRPGGQDESNATRNDAGFLTGDGLDDGVANTSDAGPFDTSQPAQQAAATQIDQDNAAGESRGDRGQSSSIQPTGSRRALPKDKR